MAYEKLSKEGVFGKGLNIRVSWADKETSDDPDERDMNNGDSRYEWKIYYLLLIFNLVETSSPLFL